MYVLVDWNMMAYTCQREREWAAPLEILMGIAQRIRLSISGPENAATRSPKAEQTRASYSRDSGQASGRGQPIVHRTGLREYAARTGCRPGGIHTRRHLCALRQQRGPVPGPSSGAVQAQIRSITCCPGERVEHSEKAGEVSRLDAASDDWWPVGDSYARVQALHAASTPPGSTTTNHVQ